MLRVWSGSLSARQLSRPTALASQEFSARLYCTERALWKLNWFLRDFGYDTELLNRDQIASYTNLNGRSYQNLDAFAPAAGWEAFSISPSNNGSSQGDQNDL
jgi:hypothetical protein